MAIDPLILGRADVRELMPTLSEVVDLVTQVYRESATGQTDVPTKIGVRPDRDLSFLHAMPAWLGGRRELGMKWVSYYPGSGAVPDSDATALMVLNDPDTGVPVAILEGMHFTNARTAASGVFAAACLAPAAPKVIGLIGCGGLQVWTLPELLRRYPSVGRVQVTSRRPESRAAFAAAHAVEGVEAVDLLRVLRRMGPGLVAVERVQVTATAHRERNSGVERPGHVADPRGVRSA